MTDRREQVLRIFREVLNWPTLTAEDDYFDVGGGSVAAVQLLTRLEAECAIDLSLDLLFSASTIGEVIDGSLSSSPRDPR